MGDRLAPMTGLLERADDLATFLEGHGVRGVREQAKVVRELIGEVKRLDLAHEEDHLKLVALTETRTPLSDEETIRSGLEWQPEVVRAPKLEALDRLVAERDALLAQVEKAGAYFCTGCGHEFVSTAHVHAERSCCPDCSHGPFIEFVRALSDPTVPDSEEATIQHGDPTVSAQEEK